MNFCEIYPCPECGGSGRIVYVGERNLHPVVRCKDCGYTEYSYFGFDLESTAIQFWNERWRIVNEKEITQR